MKTFNLRPLIKLLLIASLLGLSACYQITYKVNRSGGATFKDENWKNFFVLALAPVPEKVLEPQLCHHSELATVKSYFAPANVFHTWLGVGLMGSMTLEATCVGK